jgi:hypothetical protein
MYGGSGGSQVSFQMYHLYPGRVFVGIIVDGLGIAIDLLQMTLKSLGD